jgi:hypothetical protein
LPANQLSRKCRQPLILRFRPPVFDSDVLSFDETRLLQPRVEFGREARCGSRRSTLKNPNDGHRRLLSISSERPSRRRSTDKRNELAPLHCRHASDILKAERKRLGDKGPSGGIPSWVIRVGRTWLGRILSIFPDWRTFSACVGMSQRCQAQASTNFIFLILALKKTCRG